MMVTTEQARAAATESALSVSTRRDITPLAGAELAEERARATLRSLSAQGVAPSAGVCEAMLALGRRPVPVDCDTLQPSGAGFASYTEAMAHYFAYPADGVGIPLGAGPNGEFTVAVRGTTAAWLEFRREFGSETLDRGGEGGPGVVVGALYEGAFSTARWSPPQSGLRTSGVVVGVAAQLAEADDFVYGAARELQGKVGWVAWSAGQAWSAAPDGGRRLTFASRKLGHGCELVADGILPCHAVSRTGWRLALDNPPLTGALPEWLVSALGGRWVKA